MVHLPISILLLLAITILQCSAHQEEVTTQTIDNPSSKKRNLSSNTPSPTWLDYPSQEDSSLELYDDDEEGDEKLASLEDEIDVLKYDLAEILDEVDIVEEEVENIEEEYIEDYDELEPLSDTLIVPLMDEEDTNGNTNTNTNTNTTTKREKHKERRKKSTLGPQKKTGGHKQKHNELQKARRKHHKEARENRIKKNQATHGKHNNEAQADQNIEPLVSHTIDMNAQTASTKAAKEYPSDDTSLIQEQQIAEEETMKRLIRKKKMIMEEEGLESMTDGKARKLQHKRGRR